LDFGLWEELMVARLNDGWLPQMSSSSVTPVLKSHEIAYAEFDVALMKEVAIREFQGSSGGVSIPLGGGVRYRMGSMSGRWVEVGKELQEADRGALTVTSTRTLFTGEKETLQFKRDLVVSVKQYKNGLRIGTSNRRTTSLLKSLSAQSSLTVAGALIASLARGGDDHFGPEPGGERSGQLGRVSGGCICKRQNDEMSLIGPSNPGRARGAGACSGR
jgi:hypothetical protein